MLKGVIHLSFVLEVDRDHFHEVCGIFVTFWDLLGLLTQNMHESRVPVNVAIALGRLFPHVYLAHDILSFRVIFVH